MEIKGCVAVVTGGASGLGEACVRHFVKEKARVSIFDISVERGERIASEFGNAAVFCEADVTDENSLHSAIDKTIESFGSIHVLVNCAGGGSSEKVISKRGLMPLVNFSRIVELNLVGTFNVIRLASEKMLQNTPNADGEKGVVINTSSVAAFEGQIGQAAYSASKAGIIGMTLPIAREFADYGIRIVTIAPGLFLTPLFESVLTDKAREALIKLLQFPKRVGQPSEFAQLVKQIIENPMLNGETIRLDGALRM